MKRIVLFITLMVVGLSSSFSQHSVVSIVYPSLDSLSITADVYMTENEDAPLIILFHQARFSRGEYLEIAPKLNALGFNCLAVDQRSGGKVNQLINETHQRAVADGKKTGYVDAWPDLVATVQFANDILKVNQLIIWGSSYSSALVFPLTAKHKDLIDGILSFSPGNYFEMDGKTISDYAKEVDCPVFITSCKSEEEEWQPIYNNLKPTSTFYYLPEDEGFHGSKALWDENEGHELYWKAVEDFLNGLK